ncbi:MAG: hypothetical protein V1744_00925 [Candidatus Altiarchaeota archaeon]
MEKPLYDEGIDTVSITDENTVHSPLYDVTRGKSHIGAVASGDEDRLLLSELPSKILYYHVLGKTHDVNLSQKVAREMLDPLGSEKLNVLLSQLSRKYIMASRPVDYGRWLNVEGYIYTLSWLKENGGYSAEQWAEFEKYL